MMQFKRTRAEALDCTDVTQAVLGSYRYSAELEEPAATTDHIYTWS
jgi:hypothetical protein